MEQEEIKNRALNMQTKTDLLLLINEIQHDELRGRDRPFALQQLAYYAEPKNVFLRFREFDIPKKSGGKRHISAPFHRNYAFMLHYVGVILQSIYSPSVHTMGFVRGRSIVDNAKVHVDKNYIFNIDLKDFFPSITRSRIISCLQANPYNLEYNIAYYIAGLCCKRVKVENTITQERKYRMVLPQGSPASPVLTNIVCKKLDCQLSGLAKRFGLSYTRYADDITFSSQHNVYQEGSEFRLELERVITKQQFAINHQKTRLNKVGYRQEVTGLTISDKVNVSRKYIKDLRSLLFIWEKYGYSDAAASMRKHSHNPSLNWCVRRRSSLISVVAGKLAFIKMVKGVDDSTYQTLQKRFANLRRRAWKNQPLHTDILYRETMTVAEFEKRKHTLVQFIGPKKEYGTGYTESEQPAYMASFEIDGMKYMSCVKRTADISVPKDKICVSFCETHLADGEFWLFHEPYKSHLFKKMR